MTTAQVVEISVTSIYSLSKDYPRLDNHARQTTDTLGFKPSTTNKNIVSLDCGPYCNNNNNNNDDNDSK